MAKPRASHILILILMAIAAAILLYSGVTSQMGIITWLAMAFFIGEGLIWFLKGFTLDTPLPKAADRQVFKLLTMLGGVGVFLTLVRLAGF